MNNIEMQLNAILKEYKQTHGEMLEELEILRKQRNYFSEERGVLINQLQECKLHLSEMRAKANRCYSEPVRVDQIEVLQHKIIKHQITVRLQAIKERSDLLDSKISDLKFQIDLNNRNYQEWEKFYQNKIATGYFESIDYDQILIITKKLEILKISEKSKVLVKGDILISQELMDKLQSKRQIHENPFELENFNPEKSTSLPENFNAYSKKRSLQDSTNTSRAQKQTKYL